MTMSITDLYRRHCPNGTNFYEYSDLFEKGDNGTADEQYEVGYFFDDKHLLFGGARRAYEYYNKAATNGHAGAQYAVALMFTQGFDTGVGYKLEKDYSHSIAFFAIAAHQGHSKAMRAIAHSYKFGYGVAVNETLSQQWEALSTEYDDSEEVLATGTRMNEMAFAPATATATSVIADSDRKNLKTLYEILYAEIRPTD